MSLDLSMARQSHIPVVNEGLIEQMQENLREDQDDINRMDIENEIETKEDKKGTRVTKNANASAGNLAQAKDKVILRSKAFSWERNEKGKFDLVTPEPEPFQSAINTAKTSRQMLRVMGIKIDVSNKMNQFKQNYMQQFIQSRSPNFFVARFSQLKCGFTSQILSLLGMASSEIRKLQKEALKSAREENKKLMSENIYNIELCELVYGRTPKAKKSLELLQEMERQLIEQMTLLGKASFYTKTRLLEERKYQCEKIKEEFLKERSVIQYKLSHIDQEFAS